MEGLLNRSWPGGASKGGLNEPLPEGFWASSRGLNHIDRLEIKGYSLAIGALKRGSRSPIWDPYLEGPEGLNHIDGRLGPQCYYGVLGPVLGTPIWGPGAWAPGAGARDMGPMGLPINSWDCPSTLLGSCWDGSWDCPSTHGAAHEEPCLR